MFEHHSPAQNLVPWSEHLEKMAEPFILQMRKEMPEYTAGIQARWLSSQWFFSTKPQSPVSITYFGNCPEAWQ